MPWPTFVIPGVQRAGTTSLSFYLNQNPDVFIPARKEVHYFDFATSWGIDWYLNEFCGKPEARHRGDVTPSYLGSPEAMHLMARTLPRAKIVIVLREPSARAYSHYWMNRWRGIEPLGFEEALDAETARLKKRPKIRQYAYFDNGMYAEHLKCVYALYPPSQVHVTFFEDLRRDPAHVVDGIYGFLGVPPRALGKAQKHNHKGPVRSARVAGVARRLPGPLCRAVRTWNTKKTEYPAMDPHVRSVLDARFASANRDLVRILGAAPPW